MSFCSFFEEKDGETIWERFQLIQSSVAENRNVEKSVKRIISVEKPWVSFFVFHCVGSGRTHLNKREAVSPDCGSGAYQLDSVGGYGRTYTQERPPAKNVSLQIYISWHALRLNSDTHIPL